MDGLVSDELFPQGSLDFPNCLVLRGSIFLNIIPNLVGPTPITALSGAEPQRTAYPIPDTLFSFGEKVGEEDENKYNSTVSIKVGISVFRRSSKI